MYYTSGYINDKYTEIAYKQLPNIYNTHWINIPPIILISIRYQLHINSIIHVISIVEL